MQPPSLIGCSGSPTRERPADDIDDELPSGPDIVAAPIAALQAEESGACICKAAKSRERFEAEESLERIPVYARKGAQAAEAFKKA
jgi:hypothetical protein